MTRNKRSKLLFAEPRPLWQRVLAGERLPKRLSRHPKCEGTVEDHRNIALDVRELIRKRVFEQPVGSISPQHCFRDVLRPSGAMRLMVYARYGRAGIYMMQEYCRLLKIDASVTDLRSLSASAKTVVRIGQVVQHSRTNHQVERATKLPNALDRELMQFEILQIVLALKIAGVAKARVAYVDRRDSRIGLAERVPRGLRRATASD